MQGVRKYRSRLGRVALLLWCLAAAGCAAARPAPPAGADCERTCREMAEGCQASCLRAVDPAGHISGSEQSCIRFCSPQREVCEVKCLKARRAAP